MGLVAVPGVRAIEALLERSPRRIKSLLVHGVDQGARARVRQACEARGIAARQAPLRELDGHAPGVRHQGLVALAEPAGYHEWSRLIAGEDGTPLLVALDGVTDPGNLGAILRSAEALGATGALVTRRRCARLGPAVTRASAGASELLPVALVTNLARALREAQGAGHQVVAAALDGAPPSAIDWHRPTTLVIGSEGQGLRRLTRETADVRVTIPLSGITASLNAAVAAAVLLFAASLARRSEPTAFAEPDHVFP